MAYEKLNLVKGDVFKAEHVAHIEEGIAQNDEKLVELSEEVADLKENGSNGENIEKVGTVVVLDADASMEIGVSGDKADIVELVHQGKNFIPPITGKLSANGITVTPLGGGKYHIKGTATAMTFFGVTDGDKINLIPGTYVLRSNASNSTAKFSIENMAGGRPVDEVPITFTVTETTEYRNAYWYVDAGVTVDDIFWAQLELGHVPTDVEEYKRETLAVTLPTNVAAYDGVNILYTKTGDIITARARKSLTQIVGDVVAEKLEHYVPGFNVSAYGLPILALRGNVSEMTKDNAVDLDYVYTDVANEINRSGTASVKWQGSSSIKYPKKNYTVKFDTEFEAEDGWTAQKKYCFKANYIDYSHARNVVSAILWGQIVKSRSTVPAVLADLPNAGAIDGFPVIITLNDEFHGVYTLNIPKDGWMFGMGSGTNEAILCAEMWSPANWFKAEAVIGTDFKLEYVTDDNNADWVTTSLNRLINACKNSDGSDLDTTIAQYLDWDSAIDYYIYCVLICGMDITGRNYLLSTFDGVKWYFSAYDLDSTFGLYWDGKTWLSADYAPTFASLATQHRVMELIKTHKKDVLKARYAQLRNTVMSESNIATTFANFAGMIPSPVLMQDAKKWPTIPNTSTNNVSQIRDYYRMRVALADKWIETL